MVLSSDPTKRFGLDTLAIHAGQEPDLSSGAVMTPIVLSSTFAQAGPGNHKGFEYSRTNNPTRQTLERCLASLENARHAVSFASGCAAMTTLLHTLRPGDHIVAGDDVYGGTFRLVDKVMRPMGIEATWTDLTEPGALERAIRRETKMIWVETPTNPLLKITDIAAVSKLAHSLGIKVFVDNTFATPFLQQPLALGADGVVHSATKYLNGHSDVVHGVLMTNDDELRTQLKFLQNAIGAVPSPFDCFMVLRGVKTLGVRMERHVKNAAAIVSLLESHPKVERLYYPGHPSHPQYELAKKQMSAPGGMISFVVKGGGSAARALLESVQVFTCAESLGGVESLIELPAVMTHGSIPKEDREARGISDGLIRISVGIETEADLVADLDRALSKA